MARGSVEILNMDDRAAKLAPQISAGSDDCSPTKATGSLTNTRWSMFQTFSLGASGKRGSSNFEEADTESAFHGNRRLTRIGNNNRKSVDNTKKNTFVDAAAMKEKVREKMSQPKYNVMDFYKEEGICQYIARSPLFDKMTLTVIAFNALWISIDTDMNDSPILLEADLPFVIAENFFCAYFSFEWFVRFMSFRRKCDGRNDGWFIFDSLMVAQMVLETWLFTLLIVLFLPDSPAGGGNAGIMRLARLMRLSRMARMGKLLRAMPELMIMIKGMKAATRSVFFTLLLLMIIMYIFAIAFVQLADGTVNGGEYFPAVPESLYTLLVYGILLDGPGALIKSLFENPSLLILFLLFILMGTFTVMNMLIGVLCEVVSAVASTEQEEMLVSYVNGKLSAVMAILDSDGGGTISKHEFLQIIENDEAIKCLTDVGVDVFALIDLADYIFEDSDAGDVELDFSHFMDVVLQLRGTNQATVKDIVDLRKLMRKAQHDNYKQTALILERLEKKLDARVASGTTSQDSRDTHARRPDVAASSATMIASDNCSLRSSYSLCQSKQLTPGPRSVSSGSSDMNEHVPKGNPELLVQDEYLDVACDFLPTLPPETPDCDLLSPTVIDNVVNSIVASERSALDREDLDVKGNHWVPFVDSKGHILYERNLYLARFAPDDNASFPQGHNSARCDGGENIVKPAQKRDAGENKPRLESAVELAAVPPDTSGSAGPRMAQDGYHERGSAHKVTENL